MHIKARDPLALTKGRMTVIYIRASRSCAAMCMFILLIDFRLPAAERLSRARRPNTIRQPLN